MRCCRVRPRLCAVRTRTSAPPKPPSRTPTSSPSHCVSAIAATLAREFGALPAMKLLASGYGAGDYDFPEHANVLRVLIGETSGATESITVTVLEANIDDSSPQVLGYAMERLLETGALDVTLTSVLMKKSRPGSGHAEPGRAARGAA